MIRSLNSREHAALSEILTTGRRAHFVGIGGVSMSDLARHLLARGWQVTGSDVTDSTRIASLRSAGAQIAIGHSAANLPDTDLLVSTDAVASDNPEVAAARARGVLCVRRSELLGAITAGLRTIAVSGTHGKTTTTAMIAAVLTEAGLAPAVFVGADCSPTGEGRPRCHRSDWAVVEACEAFSSFLDISPAIAVVTNLEPEHLDFHGSEEALHQAFVDFLRRLPGDGTAILSGDSPALIQLAQRAKVPSLRTFALRADAHLTAAQTSFSDHGSTFSLLRRRQPVCSVSLRVPGEHNIANALAALATVEVVGLPLPDAARTLGQFSGAERRFQVLADMNGIRVVDDYAHHPTELRATLAAARQGAHRRLLALFQPHLYTRTKAFMREFAEVLSTADRAWVTDIYPAREAPIEGVTAQGIADLASREFGGDVAYVPFDSAAAALMQHLSEGDIVVIMGAGNVDSIARDVADAVAGTDRTGRRSGGG